MKKPWFLIGSTCWLGTLAGPARAEDVEVDVEQVVFSDSSAPICDVGDALGPAVPGCGALETGVCVDLGCPAFDVVDQGPLEGDVEGEITVCIRIEAPPDPNLFLPASGCVRIETSGDTWTGPFEASFHLLYGAFGDYFVQAADGSTIRATFTQLSADPPFFVNEGILIRVEEEEDD